MAYVPYDSLVRLSDSVSAEVTSFYVSAPAGSNLEAVEERLEEMLNVLKEAVQ